MSPAQEKGPALLQAAAEPKNDFPRQRKVRPIHTTVRALVQEFWPHFLIGAGSSALTFDINQAVTLWCRS